MTAAKMPQFQREDAIFDGLRDLGRGTIDLQALENIVRGIIEKYTNNPLTRLQILVIADQITAHSYPNRMLFVATPEENQNRWNSLDPASGNPILGVLRLVAAFTRSSAPREDADLIRGCNIAFDAIPPPCNFDDIQF